MEKIYRFISYAIGLAAVLTVLLVMAGYYFITHRSIPQVRGQFFLKGLANEVKVTRDEWGVPHIEARDRNDLYLAAGYIQAQDRLFQMELMRRISEGRLAEIFGDSEGMVKADRFARVMGFKRLGDAWLARLPEQSRRAVEAYTRGVNDFIESQGAGLPLEFPLLGSRPEPWKVEDSLAISVYTAFGLCTDWSVNLLRLGLLEERGEEVMWALTPRYQWGGPDIIQTAAKASKKYDDDNLPSMIRNAGVPQSLINGLLDTAHQVRETLGIPPASPYASNSWVVDGSMSASGKPILCNDPHLELTQPSVWYEMHLKTPEMEVSGVAFPGMPVIALGHTGNTAWAATNTLADTEDIFIEKINPQNPDQYEYQGAWTNFEIVKETISIRGKKDSDKKTQEIKVRVSRHGPIINDILDPPLKTDKALAFCWTAREPGDPIAAFEGAARAKNWDEFRTAINQIGTPVMSWTFADSSGHIGYIAAGRIPLRRGHDGTLPVPGWTDQYEWTGYVPLDQLPQVLDPPEHFIVTANNQVLPPDRVSYTISYNYAPPYRAARIRELIQDKTGLTAEDMEKVQYDYYSKHAELVMPIFIKALEEQSKTDHQAEIALIHIKDWDYRMDPNGVSPTLYAEIYRHAFEQTFSDEMSKELFARYFEEELTFNFFDHILYTGDSRFFDDSRTPENETRDDVIRSAFTQSMNWLKAKQGIRMSTWTWGAFHTLTLYHPLGRDEQIKEMADKLQANQGPFPMPGGRNTVNNGFYQNKDHSYAVVMGPSMRHIVDLGHVDQARMIITGGESGHVFSKHYRDQTQLWIAGKYHPMLMKEKDILEHQEGQLILMPNPKGPAREKD